MNELEHKTQTKESARENVYKCFVSIRNRYNCDTPQERWNYLYKMCKEMGWIENEPDLWEALFEENKIVTREMYALYVEQTRCNARNITEAEYVALLEARMKNMAKRGRNETND